MEQGALLDPVAPPVLAAERPDGNLYGRWMFAVQGEPIPQGSMKGTLNRYTGHVVVFASNDAALGRWRGEVEREARAQLPPWLREPWDGPVWTNYLYVFERSPNDYLTDGATLCKGARRWHEVAPDRDKLDRAMNDALTKIAWTNDARNLAGHSEKRYGLPGEAAHAEIEIGFLRP